MPTTRLPEKSNLENIDSDKPDFSKPNFNKPDPNKTGVSKQGFKKSEIIESLLGFAVITAINYFWFGENLGFYGVHPHPYWIIVLPAATRYGSRSGMIAGIMAAVMFLGMIKVINPDFGLVQLSQAKYFGLPLIFISVGLIIGEIREVQKRKYDELDVEYKSLYENNTLLVKRYNVLKSAKQELDTRIISQEHTVSTLYEAAQGLKTLQEKEIYPSIIDLLVRFISIKACSIYTLTGNKLVLAGWLNEENRQPAQEASLNTGIMGHVITSVDTVSINTLISSEEYEAIAGSGIIISAPMISADKRIIGILNIEKIPFLKFNAQTIRMTSLLADWCGSAIENARTHKDTQDQNISDDITGAYTYQYCLSRIEEEFNRARRYKLICSIVIFEIVDFISFTKDMQEDMLGVLLIVFQNKMRTIDLLFCDQDPNRYFMFLPNTPFKGAQVLIQKLVNEINSFLFKPYKSDENKLLQIRTGAAEFNPEMKEYKEFMIAAIEALNKNV